MSYIKLTSFTDTITYWERGTPDGFGGVLWSAPIHLKGRWEDRSDMYINDKGENVGTRARVYIGYPVKLGGYLYKGKSTEPDPTTVEGAREILEVRDIPSVHGTKRLLRVQV